MNGIEYSRTFAQNIEDIYGIKGKKWLEGLSDLVAQVCKKYSLNFLEVIPNLSYHFVAVVTQNLEQRSAILKMAPTNEYLSKEAHWYNCIASQVPELYWYDEDYSAILLERLLPGSTLEELVKKGNDDLATEIICHLILGLQTQQQPSYRFNHIAEFASSIQLLKNYANNSLVDKANSLFQELSKSGSQDVILHGDLHHHNILRSGDTWKVIDPHGYTGDPVFEVGAMVFNPGDYFAEVKSIKKIIDRRLGIMKDVLPFDPERIKAWCFCRTVLSTAWTFEDHKTIDGQQLLIAELINEIII